MLVCHFLRNIHLKSCYFFLFFFFSSRRRHTRCLSDWSSDVCSSDLLHLAHLSTAGALRMVREAKELGVKITAEACPHHFLLTDEAVREFNTNAKMNPPLRSRKDVDAIKAALKDGTIDVIATDHAPHADFEKQREFDYAPFGIVGLETAWGLALTLVDEGVLSVEQVVALLTVQPARAFALPKGTLAVGADGDVAIVDPEARSVVEPERFRSKRRNTPFAGWNLKGRVVTTIVSGRVVYP